MGDDSSRAFAIGGYFARYFVSSNACRTTRKKIFKMMGARLCATKYNKKHKSPQSHFTFLLFWEGTPPRSNLLRAES